VKTDAYGHGAAPVASALAEAGTKIVAVGNVEEGVSLRKAGISEDILVLGTMWQGQEDSALEHDLILSVDSAANLESLNTAAERKSTAAPVHIKVDTGMSRLGIRWDALEESLEAFKRCGSVSPAGVFTHLSSADEEDPAFTEKQILRFEGALSQIRDAGLDPKEIHCANSAGLLYHESVRIWSARTGIALYGYAPAPGRCPVKLRPVLSLKTRISSLREIPAGESIGYGRRFTATRTTRYTTLPIGYADGLPRKLSCNLSAIVRGKLCEVIGTISMDMITIDLTDRPEVREGDIVTLLGSDGDCSIGADTWAGTLGTIPYEILCGIAARVPRIYKY